MQNSSVLSAIVKDKLHTSFSSTLIVDKPLTIVSSAIEQQISRYKKESRLLLMFDNWNKLFKNNAYIKGLYGV